MNVLGRLGLTLLVAISVSRDPVAALERGVGGHLTADLDGALAGQGDLWGEAAWRTDRGTFALGMELRTAIEGARTGATFDVRDVTYQVHGGWRHPLSSAGTTIGFFAGQTGQERVDDDDGRWLRWVGLEFYGGNWTGLHDSRSRWAWASRLGVALDQARIDADALLDGRARVQLSGARSPQRYPTVQIDFSVSALLGHENGTDAWVGPRFSWPAGDGREAALFARYGRNRHPFGLGHDGWVAGFEYVEAAATPTRTPLAAPEIDGEIAAGVADERGLLALALRFQSPALFAKARALFEIDAQLLHAANVNDLYYRYDVGFVRTAGRNLLGLLFNHRSNHVVRQTGFQVTSVDAVELGIETENWHRPGKRGATLSAVAIDARARIGLLVDSDFGKNDALRARIGSRVAFPLGAALPAPFLRAELEEGDVSARHYAIGASIGAQLDIEIGRHSDEQWFSRDRRFWLFVARRGF